MLKYMSNSFHILPSAADFSIQLSSWRYTPITQNIKEGKNKEDIIHVDREIKQKESSKS